MLVSTDLASTGLGQSWGHTRSYSNRISDQRAGNNGCSWFYKQGSSLVNVDPDPEDPNQATICVIKNINASIWFDYDSGSNTYPAKFSSRQVLTHDSLKREFVLLDTQGRKTIFFDFSATVKPALRGQFKSFIDPFGINSKADYDGDSRLASFEQKGPRGSTNSYAYDYVASGANVGRLEYVTHQLDGTSVRRVKFNYYGSSESNGSLGDLKLVTVQQFDGSTWTDLNHTHYRYYLDLEADGFEHGLKFEVGPEAYARMVADGLTPTTATNAQVANYADKYFEYDVDKHVTLESVRGGSLTYEYTYTPSGFTDGYNRWKMKTVETLPDGNQNIVFTNYAGNVMLKVFKSGSDQWFRFKRYDDNSRLILTAESSAVLGYDETKADLMDFQSGTGTYEYLADDNGLIRVTEYYADTNPVTGAAEGYMRCEKVKKGQLGAEIKLREWKYVEHADGGSKVYPVWKETVYRSDASGGSDPVTTEYAYTWFSSTLQQQQRTTTPPVVPTSQNGSGIAVSRVEVFNKYGQRTWLKDERGFLTRFEYEEITGAMSQRIEDVDTARVNDAPAGWTTPAGGGLHLVTDYQSDDQGRITQELGPKHTIDINGKAKAIRRAKWTVYQDETYEVWRGQGYQQGSSYKLINPVSITVRDSAGRVTDEIQATRSTVNGRLRPSNTFPQSSWVRWSQNSYDDESKLVHSRGYFDIPSSGSGGSGTNYNQTDYGYDELDRRNRIKTPGGTITRTVFHPMGWPLENWVGTDDTGATDSNPAGSGAPNNMVLVSANEYDNGEAGGDGNLTQITLYENATDTRVTVFGYDFRNRQLTVAGEVDFYEVRRFDNLDRITKVDRRDTNAAGPLVSRQITKFDNRGRVYQTYRYGVSPQTGVVSYGLVDNSWYDPSGNLLKQLNAGNLLSTKSAYDGVGRMIRQYAAYDVDETSYADAGSVDDDTVMEQNENTYDPASNLIQIVGRQRFHNATGVGPLTDPNGAQPKARVSYAANYPDPLGRVVAGSNYGTNGASAFSRPATMPARSNTVLVSSTSYNNRDEAWKTVDPQGTERRMEFDDAGRVTKVIENYVSGGTAADQNRTTEQTYNPDGKLETLTVKNADTGDQVTTWEYGTALSDSDVASNELLRAKEYPDGSSDRVEYAYNRGGQTKQITDQRGSVRVLEYDKLGRLLHDRVTTLGTGVDDAVRRISRAYEVRGMVVKVTSYDNATVGSGSIVNEVLSEFNDFAQLVTEYQSHSGVVDTDTTPKLQYAYADGSKNRIRRVAMTYPDGRVTTYDYGSAGSMNDVLSRVSALKQGATVLARYTYLGLAEVVQAEYGG